jgi:hypothetical protein
MESILTSIKKLLGFEESYESFDPDIVTHINSVLMTLNQLSIGPPEGFSIKDKITTWVEFVGDRQDLESVKSYVYLKVRLLFDPPQNSFLVEAIKDQVKELEWRLNAQAEGGN